MTCEWCKRPTDDGAILHDECGKLREASMDVLIRLEDMPMKARTYGNSRGPLEKPVTHVWVEEADERDVVAALARDLGEIEFSGTAKIETAQLTTGAMVRFFCQRCEGRGSIMVCGTDHVRRDRACPDCQKVGPGIRTGKVTE